MLSPALLGKVQSDRSEAFTVGSRCLNKKSFLFSPPGCVSSKTSLLGLLFQESDLSNPKRERGSWLHLTTWVWFFRSALWADCKRIPMDLCHQKKPPEKVYQPAQILPSNFQLRQLDQKHVSKPGQTSYLLVRRRGKPSPPTPSSLLDFLFWLWGNRWTSYYLLILSDPQP